MPVGSTQQRLTGVVSSAVRGTGTYTKPRASADAAEALRNPVTRAALMAADVEGVSADEQLVYGATTRRRVEGSVHALPEMDSTYTRIMQNARNLTSRNQSFAAGPIMEEAAVEPLTDKGTMASVRRVSNTNMLSKASSDRRKATRQAQLDAAHLRAVMEEDGISMTPAVTAESVQGVQSERRTYASEPNTPALGQRAAMAMLGQKKPPAPAWRGALPGTFLSAWKASVLPSGGAAGARARGVATPCPEMPVRITFWVLTIALLLAIVLGVTAAAVAATRARRRRRALAARKGEPQWGPRMEAPVWRPMLPDEWADGHTVQ